MLKIIQEYRREWAFIISEWGALDSDFKPLDSDRKFVDGEKSPLTCYVGHDEDLAERAAMKLLADYCDHPDAVTISYTLRYKNAGGVLLPERRKIMFGVLEARLLR